MKTMAIPEIWVDFNAQNEDGTIRLTARGSKRDMDSHGVKEGDKIFISDEELGAVAVVENVEGYGLVARPETEIFPLGDE